jgi:hypothetical protein
MSKSFPMMLLTTLLAAMALPLLAAEQAVPAVEVPAVEVPAAEVGEVQVTEAEPTAAAAANADSAAEDQTPGTLAADDTFVPTVEISEDLSVSFPADI